MRREGLLEVPLHLLPSAALASGDGERRDPRGGELTDFAAVQEEFGRRVKIVAIDRAEDSKTARAFTDGLGLTGKLLFLLDQDDTFYTSIGGFSMPETLLVDAAGTVVFHKRGVMKLDEMREHIRDLVGGDKP